MPIITSEWPPIYFVAEITDTSTPRASGLKKMRRGPGVVDDCGDVARLRRRDHGGHVLHLEGERAGALEIEEPGVLLHQRGDAGSDARIIEGGGNAEPLEETGAEIAHRAVDRIRHQHMVARLDEGEDRREARRSTGAEGNRAMAALDRRHRLLEGELRGRAGAAVGDLVVAVLRRRLMCRHGRIEHGRGVIDRRVDDAEILLRRAPGMGQKRVGLAGLAAHEAGPRAKVGTDRTQPYRKTPA